MSFFSPKTIEQLCIEQDVQPVNDIESLSGAIPDEDVEDFVAEIYRERGRATMRRDQSHSNL